MSARHLTERREPAKGRRFAWGRIPAAGDGEFERFTTWHLFRRSETRRLHGTQVSAGHHLTRAQIAVLLREARNGLRDYVDDLDLRHLGVLPALGPVQEAETCSS
ncbi:hypothetical protein [Lysobacter enzymogenes]|uniref:hypothetical protein n=1 Tax=Lysobacter enzymogenes TaxID=69 RepID=UPI0008988D9F|nr:hypothetical protein [Lysobacter enzymogenes]SDY08248.1 hypothetical protein SAMN05421681_110186 [Lysobacter enzymogenes]